jgi:hypothetical protein
MTNLLAAVAIFSLWMWGRRLKRERDALQMMWLQEALERREQLQAAYDVIENLSGDQHGAERLADGRILLPPMSLN